MAEHPEKSEPDGEFYSEEETIKRRDAALKRMLETAPQPKRKPEKKAERG